MLRRSSLSCREFRHFHVEYVDGLLSGEARRTCDLHLAECPSCATRDVQIRRALLALQVLPKITPSAEFRVRLNSRLAAESSARGLRFPAGFHDPQRSRARWWIVASALAASAALLVLAPGHPAPVTQVSTTPEIARVPIVLLPASPALPKEPAVRSRASVQRSTPRFEALPGTAPLSGAPLAPHLSGVRLQAVTYIGQ